MQHAGDGRAAEPPGRRARRWPWVAGLGVLTLGVVAVLLVVAMPDGPADDDVAAADAGLPGVPADFDESGLPDPSTVALPDVEEDDAAATRTFLTSDGDLLVDFHARTAQMLDIGLDDRQDAAERCRQFVEDTLADLEPAELVRVASAVPGDDTAVMALNSVAATRDFIAVCAAGEGNVPVEELHAEAYFAHVVLARRLEQLGVAP